METPHRHGPTLLWLLALPVAAALVLGLPFGMRQLAMMLAYEAMLTWLLPGIALYLLGICVPVGLYHWYQKARGAPSGPFHMPSVGPLAIGAVGAVVVGQTMLLVDGGVLFWPCFVLAAALPPLVALALAARRLGFGATWRHMMVGLLTGSLVSTHLTILLSAGVSLLAYALIWPLRAIVARVLAAPSLEAVFYSPQLILVLAEIALVAPLVEELTKPLGAALLARRLRGPAEAFLVGMAGGVGFAILENMLYESAGANVWAGIASLRGIGGVLHPLNAGLVALGWYGVRRGWPGAWRRLLGLYALAVGLHALWNGALVLLSSSIGERFLGTAAWRVDVYGIGRPGVVLVMMLLEAIVMWRLLLVVTDRLRAPGQPPSEATVALHLEQPRRLAAWATALVLILVPVGALYGPLLARHANVLLP